MLYVPAPALISRQCPEDVVQPVPQLWKQMYFESYSMLLQLRLLLQKVGPLFTKKGLLFKVEYVSSIRNWLKLPKISTLYGAYRRTSIKDTKVIPHSFTFLRRDCTLPALNSL